MTNQIEAMEHPLEPLEPLRPIEPLPPIPRPSEGTAMPMAHHMMKYEGPYVDDVHVNVRPVPRKNRGGGVSFPVAEAEPVFAVDLGVINQGTDRDGDGYLRRLWYLSKPYDGHQYVYTKTIWSRDGRTRMFVNPTDVHGTQAQSGQSLVNVWSTTNPAEVLMDKLDVGAVMTIDDAPLDVLGQIEADRQMADWREQRPGTESRPSRARGRVASGASAMWNHGLLRNYLIIGAILLVMGMAVNVVQPNAFAFQAIGLSGAGMWTAALLIAWTTGMFAKPSSRK